MSTDASAPLQSGQDAPSTKQEKNSSPTASNSKPAEDARPESTGIRKEEVARLEVLTVAEAAVYLRVSESLVRRLIRERRIPFLKIDGRYLFYKPVVEEWLRSSTITPDGQSTAETARGIADDIMNGRR
jgi:excisionase family DNA binding protein